MPPYISPSLFLFISTISVTNESKVFIVVSQLSPQNRQSNAETIIVLTTENDFDGSILLAEEHRFDNKPICTQTKSM